LERLLYDSRHFGRFRNPLELCQSGHTIEFGAEAIKSKVIKNQDFQSDAAARRRAGSSDLGKRAIWHRTA